MRLAPLAPLARIAPLLAAVALAATAPLAAQEVLLRMKPPQGQVTRYVMIMEAFMQGGPMAQLAADSGAPFMRVAVHLTSTVTAQAGEEFTLSQVIDSARMEYPAMPQMSDTMGQFGDLMRGTVGVTRMTTRGRVLGIEMTPGPGMKEMMANRGSGVGGAGMGFGGGGGVGSSAPFFLLPADPVRLGQAWRDSMTLALDSAGVPGGTMTFAGEFTLVRMEGPIAVIGMSGTFGMAGGELPSPVTFAVTGEVQLDVEAGRQVGMTTDMSGSAPTPMGEIPMRMHMTMTAR